MEHVIQTPGDHSNHSRGSKIQITRITITVHVIYLNYKQ